MRSWLAKKQFALGTLLIGIFLLCACAGIDREATALPVPTFISLATETIANPPSSETPIGIATQGVENQPEPTQMLVVPTPAAEFVSPIATSQPAVIVTPIPSQEETYRVAFVSSDDTLNVRSGAGVENQIINTLAHNAQDIRISGEGQSIADSAWVPIGTNESGGWVNSRFLTGVVDSAAFCNDPAVATLLETFEVAVANEDSALLAQLVHPERGLRLHISWWNPEVKLANDDFRNLFEDNSSYDWGVEDGSGHPLEGTFREIFLPLLINDLLDAIIVSCNQIESGPTAGSVQLPDGYQAINYYSYYRPAGDDIGFDWGTWVLGIEKWQSQYYLSYLVHYGYEI
ncbi:MAG: hypothetical protein R3293_06010 [Candidatus Promineifilaceae bacterium]|nr:hypothetical protein [Candidatus Promineifilaceae bacterium]